MGLKSYLDLLKLIHPVLAFVCVLESIHRVNNLVGDVGHLDMGVQGYIQFHIYYKIFDLVEDCVNNGMWVILN